MSTELPLALNQSFFGISSWKRVRAHVRPRYSPGSPAMVSFEIARQVACDERRDYDHALDGSYGEAQKKRAELLGLRGIAYLMMEHGSGKNFRWYVQDLITGECFIRRHDRDIEALGFKPFEALPEKVRADLNKTGREWDYRRTFWKLDPKSLQYIQYEPEIVRD
jgi:hypothetical protein